jgi:hypothetical protein
VSHHDPQHETMIQAHGVVHSEPVMGHEGTNFESTDASVGIIVGSLVIIVLTLIITAVIVFPIQNVLKAANPPGSLPSPLSPARVVPPAPVLQVHPWESFPDLVAEQNKQLSTAGKDANGHAHVPIAQAIDGVVSQLNVRPNAPEGYTVPGGQGRDFAGSLSSMPPAYQAQAGPTIQGEIRKNAR